MNNEYDDSVVGDVIDSYRELGSISKVAAALGLSTVKVRKILITHGLWESKTSKAIGDMYALGVPPQFIAYDLGTSINNVLAYTPYDRGVYLKETRSADSVNSAKYRDRKKSASEGQVYTRSNRGSDGKSYHIDDCDVPFVVHIELDFGEDLSLRDRQILIDYGDCSNGRKITRDIVVPGDFTLYALHYAIQRLYGWQNCHLRRFCLPEDRLNELTDGKLGKVRDLDGILFRFFLEEEDGYFINDDYDESQSFSTWLRKKYTGPYTEIADIEDYNTQQELVKRFYNEHKTLKLYGEGEPKDIPVRDYPVKEMTDGTEDDLLLRLPLAMVLAPCGTTLLGSDKWHDSIQTKDGLHPAFAYATDKLIYEYDYGDGWKLSITRPADVKFSDRVFREVVESHCPVCIAKDGRMLLDDVGGLGGYIDFIDCVIGHHPSGFFDYDDPVSTLEWASSVHGWSKRNRSLENML